MNAGAICAAASITSLRCPPVPLSSGHPNTPTTRQHTPLVLTNSTVVHRGARRGHAHTHSLRQLCFARGSAETTRPDQTFGPAHTSPATAPPILIAALASAVILRIGGQIRSRNAFKVVLAAPPAHNSGVCKFVGAMAFGRATVCTIPTSPICARMHYTIYPCLPPSIIFVRRVCRHACYSERSKCLM